MPGHPFLPVFFMLFVLAACSLPQPAATRYDASTATKMPACAHANKPLPFPKSVPSEFPLPAHTAITQITKLRLIGVRMYASILSSNFDDTVKFFEDYVPLSGFATTLPSIRGLDIAQQGFIGHGHVGNWSIQSLNTTCPHVIILTVLSIPGANLPAETY